MGKHFYSRDAYLAIIAQCVVILTLFPAVWLAWHYKEASSFVLGGLICLLPNIYLYQRTFSFFGARAAKQIVKAFYMGEFVKIFITAMGFIIALQVAHVLPLWLFLGYIAAQGGFWLGPVINGYLKMRISMKRALIG